LQNAGEKSSGIGSAAVSPAVFGVAPKIFQEMLRGTAQHSARDARDPPQRHTRWKSAGELGKCAIGGALSRLQASGGCDNEFVLAATVTDTESNLNTFTPGQIVRVRVVAVNDAGQSLPSESVEQTVP
jgi:hypothetical protein